MKQRLKSRICRSARAVRPVRGLDVPYKYAFDLNLVTSVGLPAPDDMGLSFQYQAIPLFYAALSSGKPLVVRDCPKFVLRLS